MRLGGIGIATVNVRAWDGATWRNLQVYSAAHPNLRVTVYKDDAAAQVMSGEYEDRAVTTLGVCTQSFLYGFSGTGWNRLRSDPSRHLLVNIGGLESRAYGQIDMSHTVTTIRAANSARKAITIKNIGAEAVYVGGPFVTISDGFKLGAGEALSVIRSTTLLCGVCAANKTSRVCYWEE